MIPGTVIVFGLLCVANAVDAAVSQIHLSLSGDLTLYGVYNVVCNGGAYLIFHRIGLCF
jgi:hypothetical protein